MMRDVPSQKGHRGIKRYARMVAVTIVAIGMVCHAMPARSQNRERSTTPTRPVGERVHRSVGRIRSTVGRNTRPPHARARRPAGRVGPEYGAEVKRRVERTFRVSGRPRVAVRNEYGNLRIRPWNRDEVRMRVEVTARAPDVARAKRLAQDTEVHVQSNQRELAVETRYPSTQQPGPVLLQSNYDIEVPAKSDLRIENRFGDIDISDIEGQVETVARYGQTRVSNLKGGLNAIAENGGVSGQNLAGDTRVDAQFGRVDLQGVTGHTRVRSRYGPVAVKSASNRNNIDISCDSDDVRLVLPPNADPNIYIRTTLGKIYSEIPLEVQTVGDSSTARRASTSPQRIDVSSSMGTVAVTVEGDKARVTARQPMPAPRRIEHDEVNLAPRSLVKLDNTRGDIKIAGWSRNVLAVAGTARAPEDAERIDVNVEQMPDGAQTAYIRPQARTGADIDIKVPERTDLEITNSQGTVVVDSVNGRLSIANEGGDIKVLNLKPIRDECLLQATDGNISILIPPGSHVEIVASAEDGSIDSAMPLHGRVGRHSSSLQGTIGEGTTRVELKAIHGNVVIN